jgi:hypothetical protein
VGVDQGDYSTSWIDKSCIDNAPGRISCQNTFTPIGGAGTDNAVVATATQPTQCNGEIQITGVLAPNNCALRGYPSIPFTAKSIVDQLVANRLSRKIYQESLPLGNGFGVNYSDGFWSNLSSSTIFSPGQSKRFMLSSIIPSRILLTLRSA